MACICIKKYTSVPPDDYFFFDPYLWGSLGPPETLGFLSSPWPPLGAQDQKKNSRDIHVSHAQNTVNYKVFGVWGPKNTVIYSVFALPDRVDYGRVGQPPTMVGALAGQA